MTISTPDQLILFYKNYTKKRIRNKQEVEDISQEMFCIALENEKKSGIPVGCQKKLFLFSRAVRRVFTKVKEESRDMQDPIHDGEIAIGYDVSTTGNGRRTLRKYNVSVNGNVIKMDAWELIELTNSHSNSSVLNTISNLKKHPHVRWLADRKLFLSKKDYAQSVDALELYKRKPKLITGERVEVRIVI